MKKSKGGGRKMPLLLDIPTVCDIMKRGDVYQANLDPVIRSEQGGIRPVVIIQNDRGNRYSPTVIVVAVTTRRKKPQLPVHVLLTREESGLKEDSIVLTEQVCGRWRKHA